MPKKERTSQVTALEEIKLILKTRPDITSFQEQIEFIHQFTKDVLEGNFDLDEED